MGVSVVLDSWNKIGRAVAAHDSNELADFHEGRSDELSFLDDTRSPELAEAVLGKVVE